MADTLKERKIYRVLTNVSTKAWDKIAFWTTAKSVDAADGKNLQTKIGAINGITSDVSGTATDVAASIKVVNTLNKSLGKVNVYVGTDGKLHFVNSAGADSVLNFSSSKTHSFSLYFEGANIHNLKLIIDNKTVLTQSTVGEYGVWNGKTLNGNFNC